MKTFLTVIAILALLAFFLLAPLFIVCLALSLREYNCPNCLYKDEREQRKKEGQPTICDESIYTNHDNTSLL